MPCRPGGVHGVPHDPGRRGSSPRPGTARRRGPAAASARWIRGADRFRNTLWSRSTGLTLAHHGPSGLPGSGRADGPGRWVAWSGTCTSARPGPGWGSTGTCALSMLPEPLHRDAPVGPACRRPSPSTHRWCRSAAGPAGPNRPDRPDLGPPPRVDETGHRAARAWVLPANQRTPGPSKLLHGRGPRRRAGRSGPVPAGRGSPCRGVWVVARSRRRPSRCRPPPAAAAATADGWLAGAPAGRGRSAGNRLRPGTGAAGRRPGRAGARVCGRWRVSNGPPASGPSRRSAPRFRSAPQLAERPPRRAVTFSSIMDSPLWMFSRSGAAWSGQGLTQPGLGPVQPGPDGAGRQAERGGQLGVVHPRPHVQAAAGPAAGSASTPSAPAIARAAACRVQPLADPVGETARRPADRRPKRVAARPRRYARQARVSARWWFAQQGW